MGWVCRIFKRLKTGLEPYGFGAQDSHKDPATDPAAAPAVAPAPAPAAAAVLFKAAAAPTVPEARNGAATTPPTAAPKHLYEHSCQYCRPLYTTVLVRMPCSWCLEVIWVVSFRERSNSAIAK